MKPFELIFHGSLPPANKQHPALVTRQKYRFLILVVCVTPRWTAGQTYSTSHD